jgi:hypothetical protein
VLSREWADDEKPREGTKGEEEDEEAALCVEEEEGRVTVHVLLFGW